MNLKKILTTFLLASLFILTACKSNQSNYQASYERATAKDSAIVEINAVERASDVPEAESKERLVTISGPDVNTYSVVIGSFVNPTNAKSLQERMERQGYTPTIAQNEKKMYRVILSTFKDYSDAERFKKSVIEKFVPEFSDAWVLEQVK